MNWSFFQHIFPQSRCAGALALAVFLVLANAKIFAGGPGKTPGVLVGQNSALANAKFPARGPGKTPGLSVAPNSATATVWYANHAAPPGGDGTSWATAFQTVQAALDVALGDEIWVAQGVYAPTKDPTGDPNPANPREKTFLLSPSTKMLGGFAGTETAAGQRNPAAHLTVLTGDLAGDDSGFDNTSENAYHVVMAVSVYGGTELDGFTVRGGRADASNYYEVFGYGTNQSEGGGMCIVQAAPTVRNCVFSENYSYSSGGGMISGNSLLVLERCVFSGNKSDSPAGGLYNYIGGATVTNCVFSGNYSQSEGGAVYNFNNQSPVAFTNCSFNGNYASSGSGGGAMFNVFYGPTLTNCIFWGNSSEIVTLFTSATVNHCIVSGGHEGTGNLDQNPFFDSPLDYTLAPIGGGNLHIGACSPAVDAADPGVAPAEDRDGNARPLNAGHDMGAYEFTGTPSPATVFCYLDSDGDGYGNANTPVIACGLACPGNGKVSDHTDCDDTDPATSPAAAEACGDCSDNDCDGQSEETCYPGGPQIVHVKPGAMGANDGTSWADAFTDLQSAFDVSALSCYQRREVWVAEGVYTPNPNLWEYFLISSSPNLPVLLDIYGGFAGTETARNQRDWNAHPTALDGQNDFSTVLIVENAGRVRLDGFTVRNATSGAIEFGAQGDPGTECSIWVENCVFSQNGQNGSGAAIGMFGNGGRSDVTAVKCVFENNATGSNFGGTIYMSLSEGTRADLTLTDCVFSGNTSGDDGGAVYFRKRDGGTGLFTAKRCRFNNNSASAGGAVFLQGWLGSTLTGDSFENCTFSGNSARGNGGAVHCSNLTDPNSVDFSNCSFSKNTADDGGAVYGGGEYNIGAAHAFSNCLFFQNAAVYGRPDFENDGYLSSATFDYCLFSEAACETAASGATCGTGNIFGQSAQFVNPYAHDLHLAACSPAIDAADAATAPADDLDGNARPVGAAPDMGAYEFTGTPDPATVNCFLDGDGDGFGDPAVPVIVCGLACPGNGAVSDNTDCDDDRADIYLGAPELCTDCNDNNCDGSVNENCCAPGTGTRFYVNADATGSANGNSWADAFPHLQDALDGLCSCPGVAEIWVAEGNYVPTKDKTGNATPANPDDRTFFVSHNVKIYGGFAGTETALAQRNPAAHETVLDGYDPADDRNMTHVLWFDHLPETARLDGFTVQNGKAFDYDGPDFGDRGAGLVNDGRGAGGSSSPTVANCTFRDNDSGEYGGGVANLAGDGGRANPVFERCRFDHNEAGDDGSAFHNDGTGGEASPVFEACQFRNHEGNSVFGSESNGEEAERPRVFETSKTPANPAQRSSLDNYAAPRFTNCIFSHNTTRPFQLSAYDGGIYDMEVVNCTFSENTVFRSAVLLRGYGYDGNDQVSFKNCIYYGNTVSSPRASSAAYRYIETNESVSMDYTLLQTPDCVGFQNTTCGTGMLYNQDPLFVNPSQDDFHLTTGSPAIDAGTATGAPGTDLEGLNRPAGAGFDMGAHEFGATNGGGGNTDADNDGYFAETDDCDDNDPTVNPGATETPGDEIDQNCNGAETCFTDYDNDGYYLPTEIASPDDDCSDSGEGKLTEISGDCADDDATRNSSAIETPGDGFDQNCDGAEICFTDFDNDGFYLATQIPSADEDCSDSGEGSTSDVSGDCADDDATRNTGATETPGDEIDQNCNGQEICFTDADNDGYYLSTQITSSDSDCSDTGEGKLTEISGDCNDNAATVNAAATELPNDGLDQNCDGAELCYKDSDNDGYRPGPTATTVSADLDCNDPGEALASDPTTDCDDDHATARPGGGPEICANGIDENCDGSDGPTAVTVEAAAFCNVGFNVTAVTSGRAPFEYSKNGGSNYQTDFFFLGLTGGQTYSVWVRDADGCTGSQDFTTQSNFTYSSASTNATCNGQANGTATVAYTGQGFPPLSYTWKKGTTVLGSGTLTLDNPLIFSDLASGNYKFFLEDAAGCKATQSVTIAEPSILTATITKTNVPCKTESTGAATVAAGGGTGTKTYLWSPGGQQTAAISSLAAGIYTVTVKDANGCEKTVSTTVTEPAAALNFASLTKADPKCFGQSNGTVSASATGGTGTKTYVWNPGGIAGASLSNLAAGTYTVTATDGNGCTKTGSVALTDPPLLEITNITSTPVATKYSVLVSATGGTAPLKYRRTTTSPTTWSALNTVNPLTNVPAGTYHFVVVDAKLCSDTVYNQVIPVPVARGANAGAQGGHQSGFAKQVFENQSFDLVPNPASNGFVQLVFAEKMPETGFVEIADLRGILLRQVSAAQLAASAGRFSVAGLGTGVYFVSLRGADGTRATRRLVVSGD